MKFFVRAALAAALLITAALPAFAQTTAASNLERSQIESIIRDYLNKNPEVVVEALETWQAQEEKRMAAQARKTISELPRLIDGDPHIFVAGNPDGDVTVYEFFDYKCGFCKRSLPDLLKLLEDDENIRLVLMELPLLSEGSYRAALAATAAIEQGKYFEFHTALMRVRGDYPLSVILQVAREVGLDTEKLQADMRSEAVRTALERNRGIASALGVRGTPGFIIGDAVIPGAVGINALKAEIAKLRAARKDG